MRAHSPIRSGLPINKPKVVFNYSPSPLKKRPSLSPVHYHYTYAIHTVQVFPPLSVCPPVPTARKR